MVTYIIGTIAMTAVAFMMLCFLGVYAEYQGYSKRKAPRIWHWVVWAQ